LWPSAFWKERRRNIKLGRIICLKAELIKEAPPDPAGRVRAAGKNANCLPSFSAAAPAALAVPTDRPHLPIAVNIVLLD
jgi:hypothetical protein